MRPSVLCVFDLQSQKILSSFQNFGIRFTYVVTFILQPKKNEDDFLYFCTLYLRVGGMTIIDRKEETNGKQSDIRIL